MILVVSCSSVARSRIYLPEPMPAVQTWSGRAPSEVTTTTSDGLQLRGYYWPPATEGGDVILFFHGQSGNRYVAARRVEALAEGAGVLVASYRGYGDNPGTPTEAGLYADAGSFLALARSLAPTSRIYLLGYSLGAAPALNTAAEEEVAGVILVSAFASLSDVAPRMTRGALPDRFNNLETIARVNERILIMHATADQIVPYSQAQALKERAADRVRLLRVEGGGHALNFEYLAKGIFENIRAMAE